MLALGGRIRAVIDASDLNMGGLAKALDFSSQSNITNIVNGEQRLSAYQLYVIAREGDDPKNGDDPDET